MDTEKANGLNNELYKYENYIPKNSPNSNFCSFIYKQHPIRRYNDQMFITPLLPASCKKINLM